jgi:hypothetical protein
VQRYWANDEEKPRVKETLGEKFDALSLDDQRPLVRSLIAIEVGPAHRAGTRGIRTETGAQAC